MKSLWKELSITAKGITDLSIVKVFLITDLNITGVTFAMNLINWYHKEYGIVQKTVIMIFAWTVEVNQRDTFLVYSALTKMQRL